MASAETPSREVVVDSVEMYLKEITAIGKSKLLYRGQSDSRWPVASGIRRRMDSFSVDKPNAKTVIAYHKDLIENARRRRAPSMGSTHDDFEMLCELQHFGAATFLIDFSTASQAALCFACLQAKADGKVFVVDLLSPKILRLPLTGNNFERLLEKESDMIFYYSPPVTGNNSRIISQSSEFLFNRKGLLDEPAFEKILVIPKGAKRAILRQLRDFLNVSEETLYPDFYGFAYSNRHSAPFYYDDAYELLVNAYKLLEGKDYKGAIPLLDRSRQLKPDRHGTLCSLGYCYFHTTQYEEARATLNRAVELDNECISSRQNLALSLLNLGEFEAAREHLNKILILRPHDVNALLAMGFYYSKVGDTTKSVEFCRQALDIDPGNTTAMNELAVSLIAIKDYEGALQQYRRILEIKPDNYGAAYPIAKLLAKLSRFREAAEAFDRAFAIDNTKADALRSAVHARLVYGDTSGALEKVAELERLFGSEEEIAKFSQWVREVLKDPALLAEVQSFDPSKM